MDETYFGGVTSFSDTATRSIAMMMDLMEIYRRPLFFATKLSQSSNSRNVNQYNQETS